MKLRKLDIKRITYGEGVGGYEGTISFDNELGSISVKLSSSQCDRLFEVCADGIIETAKEAARELTISVIEHDKVLSVEEVQDAND